MISEGGNGPVRNGCFEHSYREDMYPFMAPYSGYFWAEDDRIYVPGLPTTATWFLPMPQHAIGAVLPYPQGYVEDAAERRNLSLAGFVDGIVLMSPADLGASVWLRRPGHQWEGPFLSVDAARRGDIWPIIYSRGVIAEVGFQTAVRWGMVRQDGRNEWRFVTRRLEDIEVWRGQAPPDFTDEPVGYRTWFLLEVEWARWWEPEPAVYTPPGMWEFRDGTVCIFDRP